MKIKFDHSKLVEGLIKLSIDGGESFREYNIADVKDTGIPLSDTQDLDKIKIIAPANILRNLNVVSGIQVEATLGKADQSVDGNITATGAVLAGSVRTDEVYAGTSTFDAVTSEMVTASTLDVTEGTVANLNATELNGDAIQSTYRTFGKGENYIDIAQPSSDTGSIIIKIPNVSAGTYRLHYMDDQTKEVYFSCTINNTFDNGYFSYYKGALSTCLEQVGVKGNDFYFKTGKAGRLYYTSDTLENLDAPTVYEEWPVNVEQDLDFPLFNATRRRATVYTNFINVDMNDNTFGTSILDLYTGNEYGRMGTQGGNIQYEPNTDRTFYVYYPDQNLNRTEAVSFHELTVTGDEENVHIVDGNVSLKTIKIRGMGDNQYLIKRSSSENLVAESPVDNQNDGTALNRTGNHLVTERTMANWDGSTDRTGDGTFTSSISHVNKIVEGEWDAGDIKTTKLTVNGDATIAGKTVSQGNLEVEGDASIGGNLTVSGKVISVDTETITTEENTIELRHGAEEGMVSGGYSGLVVNNFDGEGKDLQIVSDSEGTLRIGHTNLEPVATRSEASSLNNNHLVMWNSTEKKLVDSGKSVQDINDEVNIILKELVGNDLDLTGVTTVAGVFAVMETYRTENSLDEVIYKFSGSPSYGPVTDYGMYIFSKTSSASKALYIGISDYGLIQYTWNGSAWSSKNVNDGSFRVQGGSGVTSYGQTNLTSPTNYNINATGNLTLNPTNALVIPTQPPATIVPGAIWIS